MIAALLVVGVSVMLAFLATHWMCRLALKHQLLDVPNARSSHAAPTPRGGGAAIVLVVIASFVAAMVGQQLPWLTGITTTLAAGAVAVIGFLDDRHGLSARTRFTVHGVAAIALLAGTGELGEMHVPGLYVWPVAQWILAWLAMVWLINLFNFMDGIDGLAGMESTFVSAGLAACLFLMSGELDAVALACLSVAGASLGFLYWNWPPARIFMGDVGSGFLGFSLGALAVWCHRAGGLSLWVPTILLAVFVTDATVTLVRRAARGERWYESHRSHAYQWLSRRLRSHRAVTLGALVINVVWLFPIASIATLRPDTAGMAALVAYVPLVIAAVLAGAGVAEPRAGSSQVSQSKR